MMSPEVGNATPRPVFTVTGVNRSRVAKDQVELLIKVSSTFPNDTAKAGVTTGDDACGPNKCIYTSEGAISRVMTAFSLAERKLRDAFAADNSVRLSFTSPIGTPAIESFMSTVTVTSTTTSAGGGFFSSAPKVTTTTSEHNVIGGHTCSWGMLVVGSVHPAESANGEKTPLYIGSSATDPRHFAAFVAKLIDTTDALACDRAVFTAPPPSDRKNKSASSAAGSVGPSVSMEAFAVRYTLSDSRRRALEEAARDGAFADAKRRAEDAAAVFGVRVVASSSSSSPSSFAEAHQPFLRLKNVSEEITTTTDIGGGEGERGSDDYGGGGIIRAGDKGAPPSRAFLASAMFGEERVVAEITATYDLIFAPKPTSSGATNDFDGSVVVSFAASGAAPTQRGPAQISGLLRAGTLYDDDDDDDNKGGVCAVTALKLLHASEATLLEAFRSQGFPNATLQFSANPQFSRNMCPTKKPRSGNRKNKCNMTKNSGNEGSDGSDDEAGEGAGLGTFHCSSRFVIRVDTTANNNNNNSNGNVEAVELVARVSEWLAKYKLELSEDGTAKGSSSFITSSSSRANNNEAHATNKRSPLSGPQKQQTQNVPPRFVGLVTVDYNIADDRTDCTLGGGGASSNGSAEAAARAAGAAEAKALADAYAQRLGYSVAGIYSYIDTSNSCVRTGGGPLTTLGQPRQQQQQQQYQCSKVSMFSSSGCSSYGMRSSNQTLAPREITWKGAVAFKFIPK